MLEVEVDGTYSLISCFRGTCETCVPASLLRSKANKLRPRHVLKGRLCLVSLRYNRKDFQIRTLALIEVVAESGSMHLVNQLRVFVIFRTV